MNDKRVVWMNGNLIPETEAKISIYDSALMFGDMVFEMTRSFNKQQFKLTAHLERLYTGIEILQIPLTLTIQQMESACYQTIEANDLLFEDSDEHRLMIDVSRGLLGIYQEIDGLHKGCNVIIADFPLRWTVSSMGHLFDKGINMVIPNQRAIHSTLLEPKIKNRSRIHYLMANIEAARFKGKDNWALLLDEDGFITEGTGDNFFIIKDNIIYTPEGRNILRGISREYVIEELAPQLNLKVIEKNLEPYDVYTADEAFITGTPFCMLPVVTLNNIKIGRGLVGNLFNKLLSQWSDNMQVDIKMQIINWKKDQSDSQPTPYQFKK